MNPDSDLEEGEVDEETQRQLQRAKEKASNFYGWTDLLGSHKARRERIMRRARDAPPRRPEPGEVPEDEGDAAVWKDLGLLFQICFLFFRKFLSHVVASNNFPVTISHYVKQNF